MFYMHERQKTEFQLRKPADRKSIAAAIPTLYIDTKQKTRQWRRKQAGRLQSYKAPILGLKYTLTHFVTKKAEKYFWSLVAHCAPPSFLCKSTSTATPNFSRLQTICDSLSVVRRCQRASRPGHVGPWHATHRHSYLNG